MPMKIKQSNVTGASRERSHSASRIETKSYFEGHPPKWSEIVEQEKQTRIKHEINLEKHNGNLTDYFKKVSIELNTQYEKFTKKSDPKIEEMTILTPTNSITINSTQPKINLERSASFSSYNDLFLASKNKSKNSTEHHSSGLLFHPTAQKYKQENCLPLKSVSTNQNENEESPASKTSLSLNSSFMESDSEKESTSNTPKSTIQSPVTMNASLKMHNNDKKDKRIKSLTLAQEALELLMNINNENKKSSWTLWPGKEEKSETTMIRLTHKQVLALKDKLHEVPPEKQIEKEESSELLNLKIELIEFNTNINDKAYKEHKGAYVFNIDRSILVGCKEELILLSNEVLDELNKIKPQDFLNI